MLKLVIILATVVSAQAAIFACDCGVIFGNKTLTEFGCFVDIVVRATVKSVGESEPESRGGMEPQSEWFEHEIEVQKHFKPAVQFQNISSPKERMACGTKLESNTDYVIFAKKGIFSNTRMVTTYCFPNRKWNELSERERQTLDNLEASCPQTAPSK